ncbi:gluconokinase [Paenibacillus segetis]|uniref:Gluconate kinase n=1 Tax=Paenibacillus segetis TaxID=1325360 RepID=A0ABQ1YLK8_9BACL|nr:gluconokinase [Paenibacillus segetis]GGH29845.1 gluconate kinase [Paenibacillus segetis]
MEHKSYMIGVDIGTTSTKAILYEQNGKVITSANEGYPLYTPSFNAAEQDPEEIFAAILKCVHQLMSDSKISPESVMFVSFSSAMHSVIPIDSNGQPLMRCLTWADNRSAAWSERLKNELDGHEIYLRTGTPIHPMSPLAKLLWLREDYPDIFNKTYKFISIKEYVFAKLFAGQYVVDYSIASGTGLMNLEQLNWDEKVLELIGITPDHLSTIVPTTHIMQGLSQKYADAMGLIPSTPFVTGAADGVLSNLGVGAIDPGVVAVTIGTSGAIRTIVDRPQTDPKGRIFCYALTDKHWVIGGAVNNGGVIFRWLRDEFASAEVETAKRLGINSYDVLTQIAERVMPGSEGLLFHPYLAGERAPLWNPHARGSFFGLSLNHRKEHMIRAVLEGVIFNLYTVLLAMEEQMGRPGQIQATGGFARSPLWRQMMADIFDQKIVIPESYESSCLGAVVLGLYALGHIDSFEIVKDMIGETYEHTPNKKHATIYKELLPIYIRVSRKFEEDYEAISKFQSKYSDPQ